MNLIKRTKEPTSKVRLRKNKYIQSSQQMLHGGKQKQIKNASDYYELCQTVFGSFSDQDFYGPKATHIYFYGPVNKESVHKLRMDLHMAQQHTLLSLNMNTASMIPFNASASSGPSNASKMRIKPKPIVIHLHSPGGNGELGLTMVNFLNEIEIPLAVVVDGYACSAVTPMLVAAPFRVMHIASFILIHEGSITLPGNKPEANARFLINKYMGSITDEYQRVYEQNTQIPKKTIAEMQTRNEFMDSSMCKRWSVVDRIINFDRKMSIDRFNKYIKETNYKVLDTLPRGSNVNHLYIYDNESTGNDENLGINLMRIVKPLQALLESPVIGVAMPMILHANKFMAPEVRWFDVAAIIIRINLCPVPLIGVIDSNVDIIQALPCIMSHKRYMYNNAKLFVHSIYDFKDLGVHYYDDIKHNTDLLRTMLQKLLSQYTRLPKEIVNGIFDQRIMLTAQECLKYGLIDEILLDHVPFQRFKPSRNNV